MGPLWAHYAEPAEPEAGGPQAMGPLLVVTMEPLWRHYACRPSRTSTMGPLWAHYAEQAEPDRQKMGDFLAGHHAHPLWTHYAEQAEPKACGPL